MYRRIGAFLCVLLTACSVATLACAATPASGLVPVATNAQPAPAPITTSAPPTKTTPTTTPNTNTAAPTQSYTVVLTTGSLKNTVTRVAKEMGWKTVVWNVPFDYEWVGTVTLHGNSVSDIFTQMLSGYPVQAIFYQGNRVLLIIPRTLNNDTQ